MKKKKPKSKKKQTKDNDVLHGVDEELFLNVVNNISKRLIYKFKFGYHDHEDMKQQAYIFALEGLSKYDHKRPLENFLWTHVRNRLFNYKRNNYQRPDKPCFTCPFYDKLYQCSSNQCSEFENKQDCELYSSWAKRNDRKKNIMKPQSMDSITQESSHHQTPDIASILQNQELITFLDKNITKSEYRETYLKLKNGSKISKQLLEKLKIYINNIIKDSQWQHLKNEDN
jgi:DNA-directed RNA polymerase specialized sigma24 family protein